MSQEIVKELLKHSQFYFNYKLVEDLWSENVDLKVFLSSIKNSNIKFLEYSESDRLIYVNINNIDESDLN